MSPITEAGGSGDDLLMTSGFLRHQPAQHFGVFMRFAGLRGVFRRQFHVLVHQRLFRLWEQNVL